MNNKHDKKVYKISWRLVTAVAVAVFFFILYAVITSVSTLDPLVTGAVMTACLVLAEFVASRLYGFFSFRVAGPDDEKLSPVLGSITLDFILKLYMPVVICDESGRIIWYNSAFTRIANPREVLYAKYIDSVCDVTIDKILADTMSTPESLGDQDASDNEDGVTALAYDRVFRIKGYNITSQGKKYIITVWNERTELQRLAARLAATDLSMNSFFAMSFCDAPGLCLTVCMKSISDGPTGSSCVTRAMSFDASRAILVILRSVMSMSISPLVVYRNYFITMPGVCQGDTGK